MLVRTVVALFFALALLSVVHCDDETILIPYDKLGVPFKRLGDNSLEAGGSDIYQLKERDGDDHLPIELPQTLFFMVTPIAGDVDLYVSARTKPIVDDKGNCGNCLAQSTTAHGDFVQISRNSITWPTGSGWSFYILVKGAPDTVSSYTLTTWISDQGSSYRGSVINLDDGFPQVAVSLPNQYTYFKFKISDEAEIGNQGDAAHNLFFLLTPFNGDPDIFISTSGEGGTERPTSGENFWRSLTTKTEVIHVNREDPHYTRDGYYYIGVKAFGFQKQAYFMLSATSRKRYTQLIESVSLESVIADRLDYNYFKFYMPMDKAYEILFAVSQIGDSDPDLFIYPELDYDLNQPPSNTKCKWCHQTAGDDSVVVTKNDAAKGHFYIGVRSWRPNTGYSLMAITERNNVFLRDGIPAILPTEAGKYKYFKFFNYDAEIGGLTFTATSTAGNSLKLYYSRPESLNTHPTKEKHDLEGWSSGNSATLFLYGAQKVATHYFSVHSDRSTNVTVTASTNTTATILQNLVPLPGIVVSKDTYRYFIFDPTLDDTGKIISDISINLGVQIGEADLFVSAEVERPTKEKCDEFKNCWSAVTFKADAIHIKPDDPLLNGKKRLYIGVSGLFYQSSFITIMAAMSGSVYQVTDGTPIESSVDADGYTYFSFELAQKARVIFQLTLVDDATEASMYASKNPKPTKVSCEGDGSCYVSEKVGDDVIDRELEAGLWYISVLGVSPKSPGKPISFQFKASSQYHILQPSSRLSPYLVETTEPEQIQQIKISPIFQSSQWLTISTSLIAGHTKLYLNPGDTPATPENHKYKAEGWPGNLLMIPHTDENDADFKQTRWSLGVQAIETSDYWLFADYGSYYVPPSMLPINIPRTSKLLNHTRHFSVDVDVETVQDIYLSLRVLQGGVKIMIGQNYTYPVSKDDGIYYYEGSSDRLIHLSKDLLVTRVPLKITVLPFHVEEATIELTVSKENAVKYVVQDQPQTFIVDEASQFLLWNSKSNPKSLVITVESNTMEEAPQFYVSSTTENPDEKNYEFKSRSNGPFRQVVEANLGKMKYNIGIPKSFKGRLATISATTRKESTPVLRSGSLEAEYLNEENGYITFKLTIPKARSPKGFEENVMIYDVYSAIVGVGDNKPVSVNMKTVGGIQFSMKKVGSHTTQKDETGDVTFKLPGVSVDYVYQVNVIAHNGLGLQAAYDGFWIVNGEVYPDYPSFLQTLMIAPGSILLVLVGFGFALYFLIGSIVNVIRGKKGADIIPQRYFWADLPYLVMDGIIFIATCCRRSTSKFTDLDDEVENDIGQLNLGTKNAKVEDSDEDMGGYGAI